jgi:hypothetical protein
MARSLGERPRSKDEVLPAGARQCFACGDDNPIGMHLEGIRREGDEVRATLRRGPSSGATRAYWALASA